MFYYNAGMHLDSGSARMQKNLGKERSVWRMKKYAVLIDVFYCSGCHSCEVACQQENHYAVGEFGIKITEHILPKKDGRVIIDYVPYVTDLCHLCLNRMKDGNRPSCAKHCLSQCLYVGPVDKIVEEAKNSKKPVLYMK